MSIDYPIDENGSLILRLTPSQDGQTVSAHLFSKYSENSKLVKNILPLILFEADGKTITPTSADFELPATAALHINGHPFASFRQEHGQIEAHSTRKLCVFETRIIGRAPQTMYPLAAADFLKDVPMPMTDLHTHLSAQISGKDLIELGIKHNVAYPTAILDRLGITYPQDNLLEVPKKPFPQLGIRADGKPETAIPLSALSMSAKETLQNALSLSPEYQETFGGLEKCYYLREPFSRNKELFSDILLKIAESYKEQGIKYAELSSGEMLAPDFLELIHKRLPEIEIRTGVKLRFMINFPRRLSEEELNTRIEQIKSIAASPYIVGVDVLGHEVNKTSHLKDPLEKLATWMEKNHPDMILQIHAGENSKNKNNVNEALELAREHNIRVRIIHAVHGVDEDTFTLASELAKSSEGRVLFAFCPDSNLALNNIDYPGELHTAEFLYHHIPIVIASDGADLYRTSVKQTAVASALCGITQWDFERIHETELAHLAMQDTIFKKKEAALPKDFFEKLSIPALPATKTNSIHPSDNNTDQELKSITSDRRQPILIGGAAGTSWQHIKREDQQEIIVGFKLLLEQLDPEKTYFVLGRTKDQGVGIELGKAITQYNATHDKKFDCLLRELGNKRKPTKEGISHRHYVDEPYGSAPIELTDFVKDHGGSALFVGGRQLTRDFILEASHKNIKFGLMNFSSSYAKENFGYNASTEKSRIYSSHSFEGAIGMVQYARDNFSPDIFKENAQKMDIAAMYETLKKRGQAIG